MVRAWVVLAGATAVLLWGAATARLPISLTEVLGFVTGAACVLLVVRENIWNFPVGIANNVFFAVLFFRTRLYGDMALQFVYVGLAVLGWWTWATAGPDRRPLSVSRTSGREAVVLAITGAGATLLLTRYLRHVGGASPFLDALTTVLSLAAQWLLNRKRLENWYVWIAADVLYVWLYVHRGLPLTAVLYAIFIGLCVAGLRRWRRSMSLAGGQPAAA